MGSKLKRAAGSLHAIELAPWYYRWGGPQVSRAEGTAQEGTWREVFGVCLPRPWTWGRGTLEEG